MKKLKRIYRANKPHYVEDKHGGVTLRNNIYWHLCFFENNQVGLFGSGLNWYKPFFKREILDLKGNVLIQNDTFLKCFVFNGVTKERIIFEGEIFKKNLRLKSYNESTPDKIWLTDDFEYLDLDYEKLEEEYKNI